MDSSTRLLVRVRRVVQVKEYEPFELTEEVEAFAGPEIDTMQLLTQMQRKVVAHVDAACDAIKGIAVTATPPPPPPTQNFAGTPARPPVTLQEAPRPAAAPLPPPTVPKGQWPPCEVCGSPLERKAGISRKTNKPYDMVACTRRDCSFILPDAVRAQFENVA